MTSASSNSKKVALVVGSGGVKCAAALGLWRVLRREGIDVSVSVGCSGGSLYAGVIALGYEQEQAEDLTRTLWTPEVMKGYTTALREAHSGAIRFTERSGLVDDSAMSQALRATFGDRTFEEARTPLYLVATDFRTGERVVLNSGSVFEAVRASVSIPTVFPPVELDGRLLVDGAASDPLPVDVAIKEGGQTIIAMGFEVDYRTHINSLAAVNAQLNSIYMNNLLRSNFAFHNLAHHNEIIPLVPRFERSIGTFDTHLIPYIIEEGEKAAEEEMPYLRRLLAASPA